MATQAQAEPGTILAEYLDEKQLAAELRKSRKTIRTWVAMGEGPPRTRIGKDIYYHRADVMAWLKSRRVEAA